LVSYYGGEMDDGDNKDTLTNAMDRILFLDSVLALHYNEINIVTWRLKAGVVNC
jgi:hypothetical protein